MATTINEAGLGPAPYTRLFCMGNPLLDISSSVDASLLEKYSLEANNAILAEDSHMPIYQELVDAGAVEYVAGGATQNSARVAQALVGFPKCVSYVGCIGNDDYGKQLQTAAEEAGVDVQYLVDDAQATGKCAVLITQEGAARSLVTHLAAANEYKFDHAKSAEIAARIAAAKVFYSAGFFQTVSPDTMVHVAQHAADNNKIFCTNLSAPFLMMVPPFFEAIKNTIPLTDILFGNEAEVEQFRDSMAAVEGSGFSAEMSREDVAKAIANMPKTNTARPRMVVITQGAEPTIVATSDAVITVPIISCDNLVDTNGAGDAFVGGFLAQLVMDPASEVQALCDAGNYAANVVIQRSGCTYGEDFALP